jgi:hypothetical protein
VAVVPSVVYETVMSAHAEVALTARENPPLLSPLRRVPAVSMTPLVGDTLSELTLHPEDEEDAVDALATGVEGAD